jgi:hypothetical protein
VRMPLAECAGAAVATLRDVVHGRDVAGDVRVRTPPLLVQRDSTCPPRRG